MTDIAVYHPHFGIGGGESVCMHVLEALQNTHDVTLVTLSNVDFGRQNDYFETHVTDVDVRRLRPSGPAIERSLDRLESAVGIRFGRLHVAAFDRLARSYLEREPDLVVCTQAELTLDVPAVQYVHYPWFGRRKLPPEIDESTRWERLYDRCCEWVSGHDLERTGRQHLLTNSEWTAEVVNRIYGTSPKTVYPPVVTDDIKCAPWADREAGFVCVGRCTPAKQIHRNVEVIDRLRGRDHEVHLHVVGPMQDDEYSGLVESLATERSYVHLEGRVARERLVDLLATHRYGIHGMDYEHFGIAVAEFLAAGMIPFVPDSGGQVEIVGRLDAVTYASVAEAVENADRVLSSPDVQRSVRAALPDTGSRFGPNRFKRAIRDVVSKTLDQQVETAPPKPPD